MEIKYKITKLQLFSLLFLFPIILTLTYTKEFFEAENGSIWDFLISCAASYLSTFILIIPAYILYKKYPNFDFFYSAKIRSINSAFYSIYFLWLACYCASIFRVFILSVLPYDSQIFLLSLLMCFSIIYASFKGINAIARTSVLVFALVTISLILILFSLSKKIEDINYPVFMQNGTEDIINGFSYMISRHFAIPALVILLPLANTKPGKGFLFWNTGIHLFFATIVLVVTGALGEYLKTQIFPFYSATKVAQIGVFRRLDTIYIGIFVTGVLIITSMFFSLFRYSISTLKNIKFKNVFQVIASAIILLLGSFLNVTMEFNCFLYKTKTLSVMFLTATILLPIINLIAGKTEKN